MTDPISAFNRGMWANTGAPVDPLDLDREATDYEVPYRTGEDEVVYADESEYIGDDDD